MFFSRKSKLPYCIKISFVFKPFWLEKKNDINIGVKITHPLERIKTIQLTVEIIVEDDDRRTLAQIRDTGFSIGIEMEVAAERLRAP